MIQATSIVVGEQNQGLILTSLDQVVASWGDREPLLKYNRTVTEEARAHAH